MVHKCCLQKCTLEKLSEEDDKKYNCNPYNFSLLLFRTKWKLPTVFSNNMSHNTILSFNTRLGHGVRL
jgi:hypothetical protein